MAIKITSQIGTDKGIATEAYVRISEYQISKYGSANFTIELYNSKEDANKVDSRQYNSWKATNLEIGNSLNISLTKEVEVEIDGKIITQVVPDLSTAVGRDIFFFGYSHLKQKLIDIFGKENVIDC